MSSIHLKALKLLLSNSEETFCFTANLYIGNTKAATVSNAGRGGPHAIRPVSERGRLLVKAADTACRAQLPWFAIRGNRTISLPPDTPNALPTDLEIVISALIEEGRTRKSFKALLRKIAIFKDGTVYSYAAKPTPDAIKSVMALPENKDAQLLNAMPETDAFEVYFQALYQAGDTTLWDTLKRIRDLTVTVSGP